MTSNRLREISTRIGLMSLRERVFIFVAAAVVVLVLVQTLLIDTEQRRSQLAVERVQMADETLAQIALEQKQLGGQAGHDPDLAAHEKLAAQEARLAELAAELDKLERTLIPPERMNQILKSVVRGQAGIRVTGFKALSPLPVALPGVAKGAPAGYYRHGFEITVSGRYSELVAYLERLEALPWRLNWIEAKLDAADRPQLTLTLTVHTLSLEEAWLRV